MGTFTSQHWHGSSVYEGGNALDRERAASMADEGGVAGAITDAREQAQPVARRRSPVRWWAVAGIGIGVVVCALFWLRKR